MVALGGGGQFFMGEVPLYPEAGPSPEAGSSKTHFLLWYRGTSLARKHTSLGPYRRPMPRVLGGPRGGRDTPVSHSTGRVRSPADNFVLS